MTEQSLKALQEQVVLLTAENLAMQYVLVCVLKNITRSNPALSRAILQAFDDAANQAENFSIAAGAKAGHVPESLRIIEQMRLMLIGKDEPKREV